MRYSRQDKILELIKNNEIETQETLAEMLAENGFPVTQATISRDIKELQLIKALTPEGKYKYTIPTSSNTAVHAGRFEKIFKNTVTEIKYSGNIIVLKTLSGCANAACEAVDSLNPEGGIGSLAGDNTVFLVSDSPKRAPQIAAMLHSILIEE